MAAPDAAAGPSTSRDVYSDKHHNKEDLDRIAEANELFDAVLTGSVDHVKKVTKGVAPNETPAEEKAQTPPEDKPPSRPTLPEKRLSVYIGNFPWWTSDKDITTILQTMGVRDLKEIKFAENRVNGQSRGYAELVVASEGSFKTLLEKIPMCNVNGEKLDCRFVTRQNLSMFEDIANKRMPQRLNSKDSKEESSERIPPPVSHDPVPPPMPPLYPPHSLPHGYPSLPSPFLGPPPPTFAHMPPNIPPPMPPPIFPPHVAHIHSQPPPSLHINPAFFPPAQDGHSSNAYSQQKPPPQSTDGDFEELMNRNRAVASSAISKAVSGATAGDLRVAMETLLTAIAIIKQSRVYGDERCQALVSSLKDCLVSIQGNQSHRSSGRDKDRDRDRGRDRERERDRERDQEDFYGWENEGMSRRHRDRSWSGEKVKERSRERERSRDYRDRDRDRYR